VVFFCLTRLILARFYQRPALFGDILGDAKKRLDPKGVLNPGVIVG